MGTPTDRFLTQITATRRVVVLGGLAVSMLKEFAEAGDPFSKDILNGRKTPIEP